jgi:hypothetical protein
MNTLNTIPPTYDQGALESKILSVDFSPRLAVGETISSVTSVTLVDTTSGNTLYSVGLSGASSVITPIVNQRIFKLLAGHLYLVRIAVLTSSSNTLESMTYINCITSS